MNKNHTQDTKDSPSKALVLICENAQIGKALLILSPIIMVQWKIAGKMKGNDNLGDTPIFQLNHDPWKPNHHFLIGWFTNHHFLQ